MSPTPLIELQRRLAEAGRIRMGEKTEKGAPKRLDTWRITSPTQELIEQAAGLYGGKPKPWESPTGKQWEVVTTSAELPVLVMPGYSFRQGYEFRTSPTLVERRCDGVEMDDGKPCLCNAEGEDKCALLTRLTVALPELTTMLGWRLESKGDSAARELLASMDLVQGVAGGRPFVPAKLRIVERRGNVKGQAVRYVVPVIDVSVRYAEVLSGELSSGEQTALPTGYVPIQARATNGVTLEEGLLEAETQTLTKPPRVALAEDDEILDDESAASPPPPAANDADPSGAAVTLDENIAALNALVTDLSERDIVSKRDVWVAVAEMRGVKGDQASEKKPSDILLELLSGTDADGIVHWSALRDSLSEVEAAELRRRLGRKWADAREPEGAIA